MRNFATRAIEFIKAKEPVEQLFINGEGVLELFENQLNGTTFNSEYLSLLAYIQHFANGGNMGKKVKILKGGHGATEYEFISKHLRIYAIQMPGKKIILYAGQKKASDSSDNIRNFRRVKEQFTAFLNEQK